MFTIIILLYHFLLTTVFFPLFGIVVSKAAHFYCYLNFFRSDMRSGLSFRNRKSNCVSVYKINESCCFLMCFHFLTLQY